MTKQGSVGILMSYESYCRVERERDEARELVWRAFNPHNPPSWQQWMEDVERLPWIKKRIAEESQPAGDEGQPPAGLGKSIGGAEP